MLFVDRERETRRIEKALQEGSHVVVTGAYGMGRTSLLRYIAESNRSRWRFVFLDFERPPGALCRRLLTELFPQTFSNHHTEHGGYRRLRSRLLSWKPEELRRHILVLDNVAALSPHKLRLIGDLTATKHYTLVAIVERFVPPSDMSRLRARLVPAPVVKLGRLSFASSREYFCLGSLVSVGIVWDCILAVTSCNIFPYSTAPSV